MSNSKADQIFTAWVLMLQVASRCEPRGTLVRGNGAPHTPETLAAKTRGRAEWFRVALDFLETNTDWLEIQMVDDNYTVEAKPKAERKHPTLEEVIETCRKLQIPPSDAEWFFNKCEGNGWLNAGKPIRSYGHTLAAWKAAGYLPSQKNGVQQPKSFVKMSELVAYAEEKGADADKARHWAASFSGYWGDPKRKWCRNGVPIDWKIEFSKQIAIWRANEPATEEIQKDGEDEPAPGLDCPREDEAEEVPH